MNHLLVMSCLWLGFFQWFNLSKLISATIISGKTNVFQTNFSYSILQIFLRDVLAKHPDFCVASRFALWRFKVLRVVLELCWIRNQAGLNSAGCTALADVADDLDVLVDAYVATNGKRDEWSAYFDALEEEENRRLDGRIPRRKKGEWRKGEDGPRRF